MLRQGPGERCVRIEVGARINFAIIDVIIYNIYILYVCLCIDVIMNLSHGGLTSARSKYMGMVGLVRSMVSPDAMAFM